MGSATQVMLLQKLSSKTIFVFNVLRKWYSPSSITCVALPFEELAEELLGRLLVPSALHEDIEDSAVLIHGPPQIVTFLVDREKHLIYMPLVAWPRTPTTELIGIRLPELPTPFADGFVRHDDPTNEQEFFHIPVAERKAEIEPDGMVDNLTGEAMMFVGSRRR
jgi:hypothetical protein